MKIGILSYRPLAKQASPEEIRMKKSARAKGHTARIFRAARFQMVYDKTSPWLLYDGKPFQKYDVVITRPSVLQNVDLHVTLIEQMESMGILLFNNHQSILDCKNKIKTMQILDNYGIPMPKTVIVRRSDDIRQAVKLIGGFPIIVKQPFGSFGNGVMIVESMRALNAFLTWEEPMYVLQQFMKYARGRDMRVFVVNGKVVGAMQRAAKKGEFRSNLELGGEGTPVAPTEEEVSIALRSVQALDLAYGGVDILRSKEGPVILEVNSNPGFKGLEDTTGIDVAGAIVDHAVEVAERSRGN